MNTSTTTTTQNTTARVNTRLEHLNDKESKLILEIIEAKRKLQDNPLVDDFEMSHVLELDAKLYALMTERFALERAEATRLHFVTYHQVLEETMRQMTARLSSHKPGSTSVMSNEINLRRHFQLLERIGSLRDILTYNQDA